MCLFLVQGSQTLLAFLLSKAPQDLIRDIKCSTTAGPSLRRSSMAEAANLAVVEQEDAPTTPPKVRRNQSRYNALVDASDPKKRRQQLQKIYEKQKRESQVKKVTKSKYDSHPDVQKAKTPQERRKALNKLYAAQKAMEDSAEQRPIETGVKMEPSEVRVKIEPRVKEARPG